MAEELSGDIGGAASSAPATSPVADTSGASSTGTATTEPGATGAVTTTQGPIPFDRHTAILDNARRKTAEEVEARYAHLKDLDADSVRQFQSWSALLQQDPEGALELLRGQLQRAGRLKPASRTEQEPQPDLDYGNGQYGYSANQARKLVQHYVERLRSELAGELEPLRTQVGVAQAEREAQTEAARTLNDLRTSLPYFKEHEKEIAEAMRKDGRLSAEGAYNRVVVPKLRQLERDSVVKELNSKATASSVNPSSPSTSAPFDPKKATWGEVFKREWSRQARR